MAKRLRNSSITTESSIGGGAVHTPKYTELEEDDRSAASTLQCLLPPHKPLTFPTYPDYEKHYHQSHTNRCEECQKNFPSDHFLGLHQTENHDPIMAAKRGRGEKTFSCFVEDCDKVCLEWKKRRSHLVDKHGFPKNYDFFVVNNGTDGRRSMLRPGVDSQGHRKSSRERRSSSATEMTQTTEAASAAQVTQNAIMEGHESDGVGGATKGMAPAVNDDDAAMDAVTTSMSSLQFVPRSVTFGKRKGKSGFAKS
ncbi:hypothetical protein DOTSEDRAFT_69376 [Dothistroma septosporum NZE10]|uniref:C2H2-type domain-containing protein n=1 Tax=Dothistroma septosporum (strain NZE10 / CBS 128990) TaxID=675120 RepID=N1PVD0_DOTSN|nr:hypothetical protein DOTSEDRAFT_69376 [Dothistroma septosporum NZE10]